MADKRSRDVSPDLPGSGDNRAKRRKITNLVMPSGIGEVIRDGQLMAYYNKRDPTDADFASVSHLSTEGMASDEAMFREQVEGFIERSKARGKFGPVAFKFVSVPPGVHPPSGTLESAAPDGTPGGEGGTVAIAENAPSGSDGAFGQGKLVRMNPKAHLRRGARLAGLHGLRGAKPAGGLDKLPPAKLKKLADAAARAEVAAPDTT